MFSKDPELDHLARLVHSALIEFHEIEQKKSNPFEGMCYCASVCLKKLVGNKVILWKTRDHNNQFHWWCETPDGEIIDLTSEQYTIHNLPVPSTGRASKLKEQGRVMGFKSYQKKIDKLMEIIDKIYSDRPLTDLGIEKR